nr:putative capsid [Marmot picobirnavirus]
MGKNYRQKSQGKSKNYESKGKGKDELRSRTNDPSWYGHNEALIRDSASIPWSRALGTPVNLNCGAFNESVVEAMPGLCSVKLMPTFGRSINSDSPMNVAATSIYAYIRHANSGHANYDSPDLMLYLMAMTQVYSAIVWLQRTYGIATLYSQKNRYLPDVLLDASGFRPASVQTSLADFRYRINELISKAASLAVPTGMTIFNRHAFLYQNVYCEGDSVKDQMYMFNPAGFYMYKLNSDHSGMLEYIPTNYGMSIESACGYVSTMLQRLLMSEDMNIMSGDIIKAYGSNGIIKLNMVPTDYSIVPVHDYNVLNQIKNATVVFPSVGLDIKQDAMHSYLIANPIAITGTNVTTDPVELRSAVGLNVLTEDRIITTSVVDPSPSDTIEATRLVVGATDFKTVGEDQRQVTLHFGSEIAVDTYYYTLALEKGADGAEDMITNVNAVQYAHPVSFEHSNEGIEAIKELNIISKFKFHPCHHVFTILGEEQTSRINVDCGLNFDVDNYTIVNADTIAHMHSAALINQFNVPSIAIVK